MWASLYYISIMPVPYSFLSLEDYMQLVRVLKKVHLYNVCVCLCIHTLRTCMAVRHAYAREYPTEF